jgi:hypothetical protein
MQSVYIITKFVSLNPAHGEVYSIQDYVIKFVSDLRQIVVFSRYSGFLHQLNWSPRYIIEILLKVALSTITLTLYFMDYFYYYLNSLLYMEVKKHGPKMIIRITRHFQWYFQKDMYFKHMYNFSISVNVQNVSQLPTFSSQ